MNAQAEIKTADTASFASADMLRALARVRPVIERRNTIPVLGMLKVSVADGRFALEGTDLDTWAYSGGEAEGSMQFLIQPHLLEQMLKHGGPTVQMSLTESQIEIRVGDLTGRFNLVCPLSDWPTNQDPEFSEPVEMDAPLLLRALDACAPAISTEETRYYLNGVFFEPADGNLRMVATDGHRLSLYEVEGQDWPFPSAIVPLKVITWLRRHLKGHDKIQISHEGKLMRLRFATDAWTLDTKLIDGTYPDYRRVIPQADAGLSAENPISVALSGDALASIPVLDRYHSPALKIDPEGSRMSMTSHQYGEVALPITGRGPAFGMNLHYLRQFCPRGEAIRIEGSNKDDAMLIVGADSALTRVMMPMRV